MHAGWSEHQRVRKPGVKREVGRGEEKRDKKIDFREMQSEGGR